MPERQNVQSPFLNALRKERIPVSIFLGNGVKLQGQIESFDQFVILLKGDISLQVYKHTISTIMPSRNFNVPPIAPENHLESGNVSTAEL